MTQYSGIKFGKIPSSAKHICVDMQRLFYEDTAWKVEWFPKIIPVIDKLVKFNPASTIFTRFIPIENISLATGTWKKYYERWSEMTLNSINPELVQIVPQLQSYIPPAHVMDKYVYSPWTSHHLHKYLQDTKTNTLIISGGETDVCVLSTILGAIDLGYRVIMAADALCSSRDNTHDSILELCSVRFSQQIETSEVDEILSVWEIDRL